jgi:hypothetical protein
VFAFPRLNPILTACHSSAWALLCLANGNSVLPIRGTDRDVACIPANSASKLRIADRHKRTFFWNLIEVRHPFSLGVTVVHQPFLAFKRRSAVGIERLVAMKKDF